MPLACQVANECFLSLCALKHVKPSFSQVLCYSLPTSSGVGSKVESARPKGLSNGYVHKTLVQTVQSQNCLHMKDLSFSIGHTWQVYNHVLQSLYPYVLWQCDSVHTACICWCIYKISQQLWILLSTNLKFWNRSQISKTKIIEILVKKFVNDVGKARKLSKSI